MGFKTSAECCSAVCFSDCLWYGIPESTWGQLEKALKSNCFEVCFSEVPEICRQACADV